MKSLFVNVLGLTVAGGLLGAAPASAQLGAPRAEFFKPAAEEGADLPADQVFPQGRKFPISFFSVGGTRYVAGGGRVEQTPEEIEAVLKRVKEDGFTMIGPQYELNDRILTDAASVGLHAIYTAEAHTAEGEPIKLKDLTPENLDQAVKSVGERVRAVVGSEHDDRVAWWYVQPEELRFWRKHEIEFLKRATEAIHEADPKGRPVWMYDPGHRSAEGLKPIAEIVDIVGKGTYTNYSSMVDQRVWVRWSIEQEIEAIEAVGSEAFPILVPESYRHPGHYVEALKDESAAVEAIERWTRHDSYTGLIAGAKGIAIFSLRERLQPEGSEDGLAFTGPVHEAYYRGYAQVARELTGELGLGDVFLFGERREGVTVDVMSGPAELKMTFRNNPEVTYPSIQLANIAHGNARYLFLSNSANEPVQAVVGGLPYGDDLIVRDLFTDRTFGLGEGEVHLTFEPYQVHALRIEQPAK